MGEGEKVQITYRYTHNLLREAMGYAAGRLNMRGRSVRRLGLSAIVLSFGAIATFVLYIQSNSSFGRDIIPAIWVAYLVGLASMMLYGNRLVGAIARDLLQKPVYSSEMRMLLDDRGVSIETELSNCWFGWSAVDEVVELKSGLGLFSGCCLYPVPDQALPSGMTRDHVRERIEAWRKAAQ